MCSVIGAVGLPTEEFRSALLDVWRESRIRGLHAAGWWADGELCRHPEWRRAAARLDALLEKKRGPVKIMAHLRYSTSGDYTVPRNNQPVSLRGRTMVFNGVLDQRSKAERQKDYTVPLETDNDGEHFLLALESGLDVAQWVTEHRGSFAGLFERDGEIYALRNARRPLWRAQAPYGTFIVSTRDIALRAVPGAEVHEVETGKVLLVA